jgi:proteasome beta subunit
MRDPVRESEFSQNLQRLANDQPSVYEPEVGAVPDPGQVDVDPDELHKTGTTTVGLETADGVVLATDQRASLGGAVIGNKNVKKIAEVQPNAAMTVAGSLAGAQSFIRSLRAEVNLFEARRGEYPNIDALSTLTSNLLRGGLVFLFSPILGGVDEDGPHIYSIDPAGSVLADKYSATGSGMPYALGLLEDEFEENLSMDDAARVAAKAIRSGAERDTASGNGLWLARITEDELTVEEHEEYGEIIEG